MLKRTAKKKLPANVKTLWEVLERHSDQRFQFADDEKGGPCWHLLHQLTEEQADGLIWVEENNDDSAAVWSLRGDDSWEPARKFLNIFPPRRKREVTEIRQAIKARELFERCSDCCMDTFNGLGDPIRVHCSELLKDARESPEDITLYITRYVDDTIAVNAIFIGHCGCWLPGEFLGTILRTEGNHVSDAIAEEIRKVVGPMPPGKERAAKCREYAQLTGVQVRCIRDIATGRMRKKKNGESAPKPKQP